MLLDLAPVAAAPATEANETPPGPKQEITETPTVDTETLARLLPEPEPPEPVPPIEPDRLSEQIPPPEIPPEVVVELPPPRPEPPRPEPPRPEPPEVKARPVEKPVPRKPKVTQTAAPSAAPSPPAEAAALLRVRESWLRRRAAARLIPRTVLGRHLRFSAADLAAIVVEHAQPVGVGRRRRRRRSTSQAPDLTVAPDRSVDQPDPDDHVREDGSST